LLLALFWTFIATSLPSYPTVVWQASQDLLGVRFVADMHDKEFFSFIVLGAGFGRHDQTKF